MKPISESIAKDEIGLKAIINWNFMNWLLDELVFETVDAPYSELTRCRVITQDQSWWS